MLNYIFEENRKAKEDKPEELIIVDVKEMAEALNKDFRDTKRIATRLIGKKILNTKVFYSEVESVFLRANYRKYV